MPDLLRLAETIPEPAKDARLNLHAVLGQTVLTPAQKWGVAVAAAHSARAPALRDALLATARTEVGQEVLDDAMAAATLMAMNNVYYRFKHMIGNPAYADLPARLRMQRLAKPAGAKVDFELFALAVSALNGCEACMQAHERAVLDGGLRPEHVHDAVRIAATIQSAAVALEMNSAAAPATH
jgi:lipoyl-dependent peroxiredoxin subunit D